MNRKRSKIWNELKNGLEVNWEGLLLVPQSHLETNDLYVAERNCGPRLLTARKVDFELGCVFPTTLDYPYDLWECIPVKEKEEIK